MLIKEEYQLKVGDIISFYGNDNQNIKNKKKYDVIVKEIYSHWVLGYILDYEHNDDVNIKICMSNIDLVMQGIYKVEAIKGNAFKVSKEYYLSDETIEKIQRFNETHRSRLHPRK